MASEKGERGKFLETVVEMLSSQGRGDLKMSEKNDRDPKLVGRN